VSLDAAYTLDKSWVRRSFDRAGPTYDGAAVLQGNIRDQLLERLDLTQLTPKVVLDAGAGTGRAGRALKRRYPGAHVVALDSSIGMLRTSRRQQSWLRPVSRVCADAEAMPLPDGSVDLILSNFMVQWGDPDALFAEFRRVLAPRGFLSFTTLGPDTLRELRAAWLEADAHTRVHPFMDMHDIGDALVRAGFAAPVLDIERHTLCYADVRSLARDLRAVGARNATAGRARGLTGPRTFSRMQSAYERFRQDGLLPATYEVVFGQAWAPAAAERRPGDGATHVSLDELKRQLQLRRGT
jgi:malonyl-CoA O-methyltransferase